LTAVLDQIPPFPVDCSNVLHFKIDAPLVLKSQKEWETVRERWQGVQRDVARLDAAQTSWLWPKCIPNLSTIDLLPQLPLRCLEDFLLVAPQYWKYLDRLKRLGDWWLLVLRALFDLQDLLQPLSLIRPQY